MTIKKRIIRLPHVGHAFSDGIATAVDLGGVLNTYNAHQLARVYAYLRLQRLNAPSGPEAETEAIRIVWHEVGQYLRDAIGAHATQADDENMPAELGG